MLKRAFPAALLAAGIGVAASLPAAARPGVNSGMLRCAVEGNASFVFGSTRRLDCVYTPVGGGPLQRYTGTIRKYGVDVGYLRGGTMLWAVVAPSRNIKPGALKGTYRGVSADVAAGVGAGANALVGGFKGSVALQPLSVSGLKGVNIAAAVTRLDLAVVK